MKKTVIFLVAMILSGGASAQWKAQTAETYEKTYRMAFVVSKEARSVFKNSSSVVNLS